MKKSGKWIMIGGVTVVILVAVITFGLYIFYPLPEQKDNTIYYFYKGLNSGRNRHQEFVDLAEERLQGTSLPESPLIYTQDVYHKDDRFFQSLCDNLNIKKEDRTLPMIIVGDNYVSDLDRIGQHLRHFTCEMYGVEDTGTIWYYYRPDCKECTKIQPILEKVILDNPGLSVITRNTDQSDAKQDFDEMVQQENIPESQQQLPLIYNGEAYLSGGKEIQEGFEDFVKNECRFGR